LYVCFRQRGGIFARKKGREGGGYINTSSFIILTIRNKDRGVKMNFKRFIVIFGVIVSVAVIVFSWGCQQNHPTAPQSGGNFGAVLRQQYVLESCDQWANYCSGNYCVYNNLWGENAGQQCIYATSTTNWYVRSTQSGGGVKTYPNSSREMGSENVTIGSLTSCTSTMNTSGPGNGDYCTAWDIWAPEEVMIWINKYGDVSPWGSYVETASIGGTTWDVYKNGYPGFVAQSNRNSMTVDIKAILDYCVNKGWLSSSGVIEKIQGGFEITSTDGQERTFTMNSYSVSYSTGGGTTTTTTTAAATTTTTSSGGGGSNSIVVRARGVAGSEHIYVTVGGSQIGSWTVSTSYQNYSASTNNTGDIIVCFDNDDGENRDVQVDYITVNGSTRQAEDQSSNTGVWQDGSCGGSNSEWLHCEGCINFGSVSGGGGSTTTTTTAATTTTSGSSWWGGGSWWGSTTTTSGATTTTSGGGGGGSNSIVVRARGVAGSEHIYVTVGGSQIGDWTLSTSYQNYSASTNNTGDINVCFDNDDGEDRDVQIDYIDVNGSRRQAEDQSSNTGVWQDGSCGGSNSEWLHCEGCINFGSVSGGGGSSTTTTTSGGSTSTTTTSSSSWWGGGSWW
jgi:hypothetical protein